MNFLKERNFYQIIQFFLFFRFSLISQSTDLYFSDFFDQVCSMNADIGLIMENINNFQPESCIDILNLPVMDTFPELIHCCDDLNSCYGICDKDKKFCDDLLMNCFNFQCLDNLEDTPDQDVQKILCLMIQDYHYTYKKLFGCEYFYYYKYKNGCF